MDFIYEQFPAQDNYWAWANFEFIADDGSINEVDLLVASPEGIFEHGHSGGMALLRRHYIGRMPKKEAQETWEIDPWKGC